MLNPKLREMFPDERVINALDEMANAYKLANVRIGITEVAFENDVAVPQEFVCFADVYSTAPYWKFMNFMYHVIGLSDESIYCAMSQSKYANDEDFLNSVTDLWVA